MTTTVIRTIVGIDNLTIDVTSRNILIAIHGYKKTGLYRFVYGSTGRLVKTRTWNWRSWHRLLAALQTHIVADPVADAWTTRGSASDNA